MFSRKLATSLLALCDSQNLTYEAASELCGISPRYFGAIARAQCAPTISTLEKLCSGLNRTPNELLGFCAPEEELSYRREMRVTHFRRCAFRDGEQTYFPVCPRCFIDLEREYQAFCDRCGQKLAWGDFDHAAQLRE